MTWCTSWAAPPSISGPSIAQAWPSARRRPGRAPLAGAGPSLCRLLGAPRAGAVAALRSALALQALRGARASQRD
eukprot:15480236-Alexandrium_andersonii.AAC.1